MYEEIKSASITTVALWWRARAYLRVKDFLPLWGQVVLDAIDGSIQGDATDEQDGEDHVRESSREIHHLRTYNHDRVASRCSA